MVKINYKLESMNFKDVRRIMWEIYPEFAGADQRQLKYFKDNNATFFLYDGTPPKAYAMMRMSSFNCEISFFNSGMKMVRRYSLKEFDWGFNKHDRTNGEIKA